MPELKMFVSKEELYDEREFHFGQIWKVRDVAVTIPNADRIPGERKERFVRLVVVISNNKDNFNPLSPTVTVCPISKRVDLLRETDLEVHPDEDNNLECPSKIQLALKQPILKVDLYKEPIGELSREDKENLLFMIEEYYGLA
ncbi:type II toxin-antitoxin system PemK/MazF family toxin [Geobacillus thermodenitrificans]|jgi:mRNA-degrading endonuclease toxin of MazEF toxin-antitoxin module|uniref:type II toxin-antitoxin system PemK/MazF family toxin n=1 Tax=Geobacillus thermodenitrificans TaxID=33940 RepID=UPI002E1CDDD9|nr:type II toxin-antitoxin system PemK/MazF family toxin [Geobacillus thermodenitrificans]